MPYRESELKARIRVIRNRVEPVLDGFTDKLLHFEVAKNDFHWLMEQAESVDQIHEEKVQQAFTVEKKNVEVEDLREENARLRRALYYYGYEIGLSEDDGIVARQALGDK